MSSSPSQTERNPSSGGFAATRWTLVLSAARKSETPRATAALAELCGIYWYPLYAYVRRRNVDVHEAEDLTQEFFARLLEKKYLADVDRRKGKFRAFLLAALKHFLANEWRRAHAEKRGGTKVIVSLDAGTAESRYRQEPSHNLTPERLFERQWALTVLDRVLAALQTDWTAQGKQAIFDRLKPFLASKQSAGYAQVAAELGMTEGAVKTAVHRLRRRYRELLREEIGQTVASAEEIEGEIRYLRACL
jgi:RNA polymerase sigma-70 factor (ECF subfamily)